jgi:SAM-dependent methyltransferase
MDLAARMLTRHAVRTMLQSAGLLDVVREARDAISGLAWLKHNSPLWRRGAPDGLPLPPLRLVRASTGTSSLPWLLHGGTLAADSIVGILSKNGIAVRDLGAILDFGCGCGRVIRHWAGTHAAIHGCDYNRRSIRWCRRHLTFAAFEVNGLRPPLPYADERFDLVYALSVFTHLPEPLLSAWMSEIERVVKRGGYLVISTHGEPCLSQLTPEQQAEFRSGRIVVKDAESAGTNRCGVYMSEECVRMCFASRFRVVDLLPQGAKGNPPQDLVLLQKTTPVPGPRVDGPP